MRRIVEVALVLSCFGAQNACLRGDSDVSDSEVATSVVSGALNTSSGSTVGWNDAPRMQRSRFASFLNSLNPIGTAFGATWSCSGDSLNPTFAGPGSYAFTPVSCSVNWGLGHTASSKWSGNFTLDYGASCDATHAFVGNQAAGCTVTRTTSAGGNTRTITGPDDNAYAITHDTNGEGSGWDSSVTPAPSNAGVVATCGAGGCPTGGTLVISGSRLTGNVTPAGGAVEKIWDHTVSTSAGGVVVTVSGGHRVVNGSVTVQHNIVKATSTVTFNDVSYADGACCFPTTGSVTAAIASGPHAGKSESLTFGAICGEATLVNASGLKSDIVLQHCL